MKKYFEELEEYIREEYGDRCEHPDSQNLCPVCVAWKCHDYLLQNGNGDDLMGFITLSKISGRIKELNNEHANLLIADFNHEMNYTSFFYVRDGVSYLEKRGNSPDLNHAVINHLNLQHLENEFFLVYRINELFKLLEVDTDVKA